MDFKNLKLPEDAFFPGQFDADINENIANINERMIKLESDSKKEAKRNQRHFVIEVILSLIAALASVISVVQALNL